MSKHTDYSSKEIYEIPQGVAFNLVLAAGQEPVRCTLDVADYFSACMKHSRSNTYARCLDVCCIHSMAPL